jgi:predicted ATP-dependent serine protease
MAQMKKCDFCGAEVPKGGQCNKCGFVDGLRRMPTKEEFEAAKKVNEKAGYKQYRSLDQLVLDE